MNLGYPSINVNGGDKIMSETNKKKYEYIDVDNLDSYVPEEREMEYIEYLARKARKEMEEIRQHRLEEAIEKQDIRYLKYAYQNVPTHKLIQMLLQKILKIIIK